VRLQLARAARGARRLQQVCRGGSAKANTHGYSRLI
jgi:hypothetical protein